MWKPDWPALIFPFVRIEDCKSFFTLSSISCDEDETTDTAQQREKDEDDSEGDDERPDDNSDYDDDGDDDGLFKMTG